MTRRIAIIPARGGSKRIPRKNVRDFCGHPMISYVLNAARGSKLFDTIHVSTDDRKIKQTVEQLGFPIDFLRPDELADDTTPIMPVLNYVLNKYMTEGQTFDEVWLLMACSPLLESADLIQASEFFSAKGKDKSVIAVAEYPAPVEWAMKQDENGMMIPIQPGMFAIRSQDLEKKYFDAGVFVIYPTKDILIAKGSGSDLGKLGFIFPKEKTVDIDTESDWKLAEALYAYHTKTSKGLEK